MSLFVLLCLLAGLVWLLFRSPAGLLLVIAAAFVVTAAASGSGLMF